MKQELESFVGKEFNILVNEDDGKGLNRDTLLEIKALHEQSNGSEMDEQTDVTNKTDEGIITLNQTMENATSDKEKVIDTSKVAGTKIKKMAPAKTIPYIPHAYQLSIDRRTIRRNPSLEKFHNWLKIQSEAGFLTRQETVSMIPPVILSPEPHHSVLDMCAAPGSKTSQLLEIVGEIQPGQPEPVGYVVANDSDAKRAYMLVHQLRRLNSPAVFVTSADARFWPMLNTNDNQTGFKNGGKEGMFDRVLCDVPCSGDGTVRKNPYIWKRWCSSVGTFNKFSFHMFSSRYSFIYMLRKNP